MEEPKKLQVYMLIPSFLRNINPYKDVCYYVHLFSFKLTSFSLDGVGARKHQAKILFMLQAMSSN